MSSPATAQALTPHDAIAGDPTFDAEFYSPYEAAAQAAFEMLCAARSRHVSDVLTLGL